MSKTAWYFAGLATAGAIAFVSGLITLHTLHRRYDVPLGERLNPT